MAEKMTCYYDADGNLINIGEWDFMEFPVYDDDGFLVEVRQDNLPPDGYYTKVKKVTVNEDGSRTVTD